MVIRRDKVALFLIGAAYFLVLVNAPLIVLGIKYGYLAMLLVLIVFLLVGKLSLSRIEKFSLHFIYLFTMFACLILTLAFFDGGFGSLVAFGLYTLPLIVWIGFYSSNISLSYVRIFCSTYILSLVVACLGVVQYIFSPNLFGYIPVNSLAIEWAMDKPFVEYVVFFRATSTLGSPQVFGLFCALNLILTLRFKSELSAKLYYVGLMVFFVGGGVSGNKTFFLILILYVTATKFKNLFSNLKYFLFLFLFTVVVIYNQNTILKHVPMLERVTSITSIVEGESSGRVDTRLASYFYILTNSNPLVGEGLGSIANKSTEKLKAAESYFLKIYYEAGAFTMSLFFLLCFLSYLQARRIDSRDSVIVALIILSMVVVHAFESPAFFIIWGYLLGTFVHFSQNSRLRNESQKAVFIDQFRTS